MATKRKHRRKTHRFYYGMRAGKRLYWMVPYSDAKWTVFLDRTTKDVMRGKQGVSLTCADAYCSMRLKKLFPHDVVIADFLPTVCFIADRIRNGKPSHCYRYAHDDVTIPEFDDNGGKQRLIESGKAVTRIKLSPPRAKTWDRGSAPRSGNPHGTGPKARPSIPRGALARAKAAGLITI